VKLTWDSYQIQRCSSAWPASLADHLLLC